MEEKYIFPSGKLDYGEKDIVTYDDSLAVSIRGLLAVLKDRGLRGGEKFSDKSGASGSTLGYDGMHNLLSEPAPEYERDRFIFIDDTPSLPRFNEQRYTTPEATYAPTAHRFRTRRLRQGTVGEFVKGLRHDPETKELVGAFTRAKETLNAMPENSTSDHRALTPFLAGIMNRPETRESFMAAIDTTAKQESESMKDALRDGETIRADIVIVGGGVQAAVAAARMRADNPELSIIVVDKNEQIGGQFRGYGRRPSFRINSRNHRPDKGDVISLPGEESNLNPFGEMSVLQLPHITTDTYPTNTEMGDTAAVNLFFSAPTLLTTELTGRKSASNGAREDLTLQDTETGEAYTINAQRVFMLTGAGERKLDNNAENIWSVERLLAHFGNKDERFPMQPFIGKSIALIGGGDSGRIVAELFARVAPREAYGSSVAQLGGPELVTWYGVDFGSRDEYCENNRSRYQLLKPFILDEGETPQNARMIRPATQKVEDIEPVDNGVLLRQVDDGRRRQYDIVIDARTLRQETGLTGFDNPVTDEEAAIEGIGRCIVGRRLAGTNVYIGGPAARTKLTNPEKNAFSNAIKENTVAIWANAPRVDVLSSRIAKEVTPGPR